LWTYSAVASILSLRQSRILVQRPCMAQVTITIITHGICKRTK